MVLLHFALIGLEKLALIYQPIRCKTKMRHAFTHIFPRFVTSTGIYLLFLLVRCDILFVSVGHYQDKTRQDNIYLYQKRKIR